MQLYRLNLWDFWLLEFYLPKLTEKKSIPNAPIEEMIQFDTCAYFSDGLVQPPTRKNLSQMEHMGLDLGMGRVNTPTWRIIPFSKWLINIVMVSPLRIGLV